MEINIEQFQLWIAALRSGEYKQTKKALQDEHGYCCLGVACKVLIPEENLQINAEGFIEWGLPAHQSNSPQWLKYINGDFISKTGSTLVKLNDEDNLTFNEIADLLEKTYLSDGD